MDSEEYRYSAEWSVGIESKDTHFLLRPSQSESEDSNFSTETPPNSTISRLLHRFWWLQPLVITILSSILCIQIYRDTTGFHSRCVSSISIHCKSCSVEKEQISDYRLQPHYLRQGLASTRRDTSMEPFSFRLFGEESQVLSLIGLGMLSLTVSTKCERIIDQV
jgi:hypothetical protein